MCISCISDTIITVMKVILPFLAQPVTFVQEPEASHCNEAGEGDPSYPDAQFGTPTVLRYSLFGVGIPNV